MSMMIVLPRRAGTKTLGETAMKIMREKGWSQYFENFELKTETSDDRIKVSAGCRARLLKDGKPASKEDFDRDLLEVVTYLIQK